MDTFDIEQLKQAKVSEQYPVGLKQDSGLELSEMNEEMSKKDNTVQSTNDQQNNIKNIIKEYEKKIVGGTRENQKKQVV